MSSYERYDATRRRNVAARSGRSALGYWIPLALTVTIATAGLIAWVWSERADDDDDDYDRAGDDVSRSGPTKSGQSTHSGQTGAEAIGDEHPTGEGFMARMSGALRGTQSPQQFLDNAGKMVSAAGEAVGLSTVSGRSDKSKRSLRAEREEGFSDHERWTEEAITQQTEDQVTTERSRGKARVKRTIAVVLSAESSLATLHSDDDTYRTEHAVSLAFTEQAT